MKKVYIISDNKNIVGVFTNRMKAIEQIELIASRIESGQYYLLTEEQKALKPVFYCQWDTINKQNEPETIERLQITKETIHESKKISTFELKQYETNLGFVLRSTKQYNK